MSRRRRRLKPGRGWALLLLPALAAVAPGAVAQAQPPIASFARACEDLRLQKLPGGTEVRSSEAEPATKDQPARCVVRGSITTSPRSVINFRVDLPEQSVWNANLLYMGGGGFDGFVPTETPFYWHHIRPFMGPDFGRIGNFVLVSSDSGHQGRGPLPLTDFSWAAGNSDAVLNHADRANHLTLWTAVGLAKSLYGREPKQRYMFGQSNGGRQGLVSAQRHPEDYHGIVALEPAISQEGFAANMTAAMRHIYSRPENWLGPEARDLFVRAQVKACDGLDGANDGVIANYRACKFDPAELVCTAGAPADPKRCLTPGQAQSIRMIYDYKRANVPLADGITGYPGHGIGADTAEWGTFIFGSSFEARDAMDFVLADNIVKVVTNDPNASVMTHDPSQWAAAYLALSKQIDATNPDLSAFLKKGGKLIIWYGAGDLCVSVERTAEYVRAAETLLGREKARSFLRFFVTPSQGHSLTGAGPQSVPLLSAMEAWVEKGRAPAKLIATRIEADGKPAFTRPLCEYGSFAKYKGSGDQNQASSFTCAAQ